MILILFVLSLIASIFAAPPPPRPKFVNPFYKTTAAPPTSSRLPASLLDLFLPQDASKTKSNSEALFNYGFVPTTTAAPNLEKSVLGVDFGQVTRLCETVAAANRGKKMSDAIRAAANQPKDLMGWMELVRQAEPIPFETFACQMLERLLTNPDEFVADLLRLFMPASATGNMFQQFPQFNLQAQTPQPKPIPPTPPAPTSTTKSLQVTVDQVESQDLIRSHVDQIKSPDVIRSQLDCDQTTPSPAGTKINSSVSDV